MHQDIDHILITQEQLQARIKELGADLTRDYAGKRPVFLGVLRGVVHFFAEVTKYVDTKCQYDFMAVSSYGNSTESSGVLNVKMDVSIDLKGRHVVILEDILDTGNTLSHVKKHLLAMEPASLKICTLLDKPSRRTVELEADYVGFTIPNEFVVGFGLDYMDYYRNLPYIGVIKPGVQP